MNRKVAVVHDWLNGMRGGERVLEHLLDIFPEADIFTLFLERERISQKIKSHEIVASSLNKFSLVRKHYRHFLPLLPAAVESFNLTGYDLIVSISHCVAKGVIPPPGSLHIGYINSPMRYIWDQYDSYFGNTRGLKRSSIRHQASKLRMWDVTSSSRVDYFIGNSNFIKQRIEKYYRREAAVIHPPVDVDFFRPKENPGRKYFLSISAFVPYKRNRLLVEAFNKMGHPLVIVGKGTEEKRLKKMARPNIVFKKDLSADEIRELYQDAVAYVFAGVEDFGITFVEAQACGIPVISPRKGGVLDIVRDGETGILYRGEDVESIVDAVGKLQNFSFKPSVLRENSLKFSGENFKAKIKKFIEEKL